MAMQVVDYAGKSNRVFHLSHDPNKLEDYTVDPRVRMLNNCHPLPPTLFPS